jgi:hypothetical protein
VCRWLISLFEELKEPSWPDDVGSEGLSPPPKRAIRGDECDLLIRGVRDDINEHVVAAATSVEDRYTVGEARLCAIATLAFQDDEDRLGYPS